VVKQRKVNVRQRGVSDGDGRRNGPESWTASTRKSPASTPSLPHSIQQSQTQCQTTRQLSMRRRPTMPTRNTHPSSPEHPLPSASKSPAALYPLSFPHYSLSVERESFWPRPHRDESSCSTRSVCETWRSSRARLPKTSARPSLLSNTSYKQPSRNAPSSTNKRSTLRRASPPWSLPPTRLL
jgi:hypothetical protein